MNNNVINQNTQKSAIPATAQLSTPSKPFPDIGSKKPSKPKSEAKLRANIEKSLMMSMSNSITASEKKIGKNKNNADSETT